MHNIRTTSVISNAHVAYQLRTYDSSSIAFENRKFTIFPCSISLSFPMVCLKMCNRSTRYCSGPSVSSSSIFAFIHNSSDIRLGYPRSPVYAGLIMIPRVSSTVNCDWYSLCLNRAFGMGSQFLEENSPISILILYNPSISSSFGISGILLFNFSPSFFHFIAFIIL